MIKFINVSKMYNEDIIIDDFNYTITKGDLVLFTGINAKIVLRMIYGEDSEYKGDIFVDNQNIRFLSKFDIGKNIGYVKLNIPYIDYLSVEENLKLRYYAHKKGTEKFKENLFKLTYNTPIFNKLDKKIPKLSSLEKYYFYFVSSLIDTPKIVVMEDFYIREMHSYIIDNIRYLKSMGVTVVIGVSNKHHAYYFDNIEKRIITL